MRAQRVRLLEAWVSLALVHMLPRPRSLARIAGHAESIKRMYDEGRDCSEILVQIAAVRSALNNVGKIVLEDHINHCVVDAIKTGDERLLADLSDALEKFLK